ncbi:MAG: LysR family transcriptional regulator [Oscillospiraceae bacterium]|nr:LysR family transcriptional regulator [Oscillospiraceae bacterium]
MNSRQIDSFLTTARLLNFTKAAEVLILPQPAVSRYVSGLEEELGVQLFIRENSRKISLSTAGKAYFDLFQRFSLEFSHVQNQLARSSPFLRLGYNTGWNLSDILFPAIQHCKRQYPGFRIELECLDFKDLVDSVSSKQLDAVISMENYLIQEPDLNVERITSIPRCIIYSELLDGFHDITSPADFYAYDFFIVDDSRVKQICRDTEGIFEPYRFVPRFVALRNLDTVLACVENGLGVAVVDRWFGDLSGRGLHSMEIDDKISIAFGRGRYSQLPAAEAFLSSLKSLFREETPVMQQND